MTAFGFFRLNITANNGVTAFTLVGEFAASETAGGATIFVSGTPNAASISSPNEPRLAFDGDATTYWETASGSAIPTWLSYELASGVTKSVVEYKITEARDVGRMPRDWTLEGSNDGSTWTVLDTQTGISWTTGETKTFTVGSVSPALVHFRGSLSPIGTRVGSRQVHQG